MADQPRIKRHGLEEGLVGPSHDDKVPDVVRDRKLFDTGDERVDPRDFHH